MNSVDRAIMASANQANSNMFNHTTAKERAVDPPKSDSNDAPIEEDDAESVSAMTPLLEHSFIHDDGTQDHRPLSPSTGPERTVSLQFDGPPLPSYDEATGTFQVAIHAVYIDLSRRQTVKNPYCMVAVHDFHISLTPTTTFKEFGRKFSRQILDRNSPGTMKRTEQFCILMRLEYVEARRRLGLRVKKKRTMVVGKENWADALVKLRGMEQAERRLSVEYQVVERY